MPDGSDATAIRVIDGLHGIDAADWDGCAGEDSPFVSHAFLKALEDSGSVGGDAGWLPQHLVVENAAGQVTACAPMYLKSHSYGEYVFDHGWADAYERAGGRYYPKLQVSVPFTPVTGPRLLVRPGDEAGRARRALVAGMVEVARRIGVSSLHVTFPSEEETRVFEQAGLLLRLGEQFHWRNDGYQCFDDFLAALSSRKRKAVRKERRQVAESGVRIHMLSGDDIRPVHWDAFFRHYTSTSDRKWGYPYLTREFFDRIGASLRDRILLVMAEHDGRLVAGALNLLGQDAIYGRNWGCDRQYKFLHFEACYYRAIDFAIETGLARVEAGAQGPHKIQRGYLPVRTWSAHWIRDPGFREAVADYLDRERVAMEGELRALAAQSPFRQET
ncbi:MAG: GNAT family N-acetyltransferase [Alphaproteobacteria bacterium]|nr:GNAT family N-acetyltransferase [Alphaproteobacteria bacterium]